jgi:hypothetical protein
LATKLRLLGRVSAWVGRRRIDLAYEARSVLARVLQVKRDAV